MALRYKFPFRVDFDDRRELIKPVLPRPPRTIEFRAGADLLDVASRVASNQSVLLDAAVGAGKTTKFPQALAKVTRSLVFYVASNPLLVYDVYHRVVKVSEAGGDRGVPMHYYADGSQPVPRSGVVYMSAATLVALVIRSRGIEKYGDVSIVLDEAHESDAYTHLIRSLAINFGATRLVQASATLNPSGFTSRETPGEMVEGVYSRHEAPDTWDVEDKSKPWCFSKIDNNLLIFVDMLRHVKYLKRVYEDCHMLVYHLHSNSTVAEFSTAMKALRDVNGPLVVILADSTFRSGFTFDVSRIIDTGVIGYYACAPGQIQRNYRLMYSAESLQAAGRAGRLRPGKNYYFRPDDRFAQCICDLEATDREAAAFLSKCMGFAPSGILRDTYMANNYLPVKTDAFDALNGMYPLLHYAVNEKGVSREPTPPPTEAQSSDTGRADSAIGIEPDKAVDTRDDYDYAGHVKRCLFLEERNLTAGKYYCVPGLKSGLDLYHVFPDGLRSVRRFVSSATGKYDAAGLTKSERHYAISLVLERYNSLNVELDAIDEFIRAEASKGVRDLRSKPREFMMSVFESSTQMKAERGELLSCFDVLTYGSCDVSEMPSPKAVIVKRAKDYAFKFESYESKYAHKLAESEAKQIRQLENVGAGREYGRLEYGHEETPEHVRRYSSKVSDCVPLADRVRITLPNSSSGSISRTTTISTSSFTRSSNPILSLHKGEQGRMYLVKHKKTR